MPVDPIPPFDVAVTDLGNLAVVGPAAVVCWLWLMRRWNSAISLRFLGAVLVTFVATCALKALSRLVGETLVGTPFELSTGAPSGHMAMCTIVYGGMAILLLRLNQSPVSLLAAASSVMTLIGVGITRVVVRAHTPADVAIGFLLGCAAVVWLCWSMPRPSRVHARHTAELLVLLVGIVLLMHLSGFRLDSAKFI
jgi:membrane-associated phospholipid phosphatase